MPSILPIVLSMAGHNFQLLLSKASIFLYNSKYGMIQQWSQGLVST